MSGAAKRQEWQDTMQKDFRRRILAGALAAAVSLCASPLAAAEEPALYYDTYGAEFYLTPEEAGEWFPAEAAPEADLSMRPVVIDLPEEQTEEEPAPEEPPAEDLPEADAVQPAGDSLKELDSAFAVDPVSGPVPEPVPYEEETVEVTVTWGEMQFEYVTGVWTVPEDGAPYYDAPDGGVTGWQPVDNSNTILFENSGTAAVKLTCSYEENIALELQNHPAVTFLDENGTSYFTLGATHPEVTLPARAVEEPDAAPLTIYVDLTGSRPEKPLKNAVLGTITATISAVEEGEQEIS